jgi:dUTP pyrophosphatase
MQIQATHPNFMMPTKGSDQAAAHDVYMPEAGELHGTSQMIDLGFAAAVPAGHVALLLPRSSAGAKHGVELNNTCGVIDSDYRGTWKAALKTKNGIPFSYAAGDRLVQFLVVPVVSVNLEQVEQLTETERGSGGFGSSGK